MTHALLRVRRMMSAVGNREFLSGGGELGARMRAMDWTPSALGPAEGWPRSLKTAVRIMLTSRQPMWIGWGRELVYLYNDAYKSIIGGKHPDALGRPTSEVWSEIWGDVGPRIERVMRDNEGTYDEELLLIMERHGYREETYYTFSYSPIPDDDGGSGGLLCANSDDTQRVLRERQLALLARLTAETLEARTIADACSLSAKSLSTNPFDFPFAGVYLADWNQRRMLLAGASGIDASHPGMPAHVSMDEDSFWPFAEAMQRGSSVYLEELPDFGTPLPCGGWSEPPRHAVAVPIDALGRAGSAGVLVAGLSPLRLFDAPYRESVELVASQIAASVASAQAYEDEARRAEALAEIDAAKTAFFSNVSHEFRTPLTLMLGPLEEALAHPERGLRDESLETTYRNALRLLKLVNSLLDFSRIEAGRVRSSFAPADLPTFTGDLASVFRAAIERAGLRFMVSGDPLPEPVYVDAEMWETIVLNLISNAFKFTFEGEIEVAVRSNGSAAELTVRDTGIGIPANELPRLFERFHRIDNVKARTYEGSGIGLALVQELVRIHGGQVRVESVSGRGTLFTVTLPFGTAHLPQERIQPRSAALQASTRRAAFAAEVDRWLIGSEEAPASGEAFKVATGNARLLIADDNADMREYLVRLLDRHWAVETARNGAEAVAILKERRFDLILTDVMMPELDGFGLLHEIRNDPRLAGTPVIMLSGRAGEESRVDGLAAGADDYVVKPFSARELIARVATHLQIGRLRREAELQREHLFSLFMRAPMPIVILRGADYLVELANQAACEVWGRTHEEVIGQPLFDALPEARGQAMQTLLDDVLHNGVTHVGKELLVKLDRFHDKTLHDTYFNFVYTPMRTIDGADVGVLVTAADVTDEVVARENMNDLREQAEAANRAKDDFLAMLGHELRTPLTAIMGWSRMLRLGLIEPEAQGEAVEAIERAAKTQTQLIEDLLDVSRIVSGKLRLEVQPVDLTDVIPAALSAVKPAANAQSIRLQVVLDPAAGPVAGDPDRLQQIVWNLLSNAVKFTPRNGHVQVRLERVSSYAELTVSDSGKGIASDFLPHVFERFLQAESTTTRSHGGLGLGLSIVRSLVELHGGTVEARSEGENRGAAFIVRLPIMAVQNEIPRAHLAAPRRQPRPETQISFDCPAELTGSRVLVVDDDAETRRLLTSIILRCQASVTSAGSVREALKVLDEQEIDVLVSDIEMAGEDGYALIHQLRLRGSRTPAAALTAHARTEDQMRALRAGFDMHVAKPVDPGELVTVIASLLRRSAPAAPKG